MSLWQVSGWGVCATKIDVVVLEKKLDMDGENRFRPENGQMLDKL